MVVVAEVHVQQELYTHLLVLFHNPVQQLVVLVEQEKMYQVLFQQQ